MTYLVIHSTSPDLLMQAAIVMQLEGVNCDSIWNNEFHPMMNDNVRWLCYQLGQIRFHNHRCHGNPTRFTLTSANFDETLEEVIKLIKQK